VDDQHGSRHDARVLVVDDEPSIVRLMTRALQGAGYRTIEGITDPVEALAYLDHATPDLVVLDLSMPGVDGYAILEAISSRLPQDTFLPVMVVSGMDDMGARHRSMRAGAKDYLVKPIDLQEFILHVDSLVDTRMMSLRLQHVRGELEDQVRLRTQELHAAHLDILERLGRVAEVRDDATGQHTNRVARLGALIANELGYPEAEIDAIMRAAPLHDVGKIAIPDRVLLKNGRFEGEEREIMQTHCTVGAELLKGGRSELIQLAEEIAFCHHERWDGLGYPRGLAGEEIPEAARIVAVADAFDALTHERPYKEAWSVKDSLAELERERGRQFDPKVVDAFLRLMRREATYPSVPAEE